MNWCIRLLDRQFSTFKSAKCIIAGKGNVELQGKECYGYWRTGYNFGLTDNIRSVAQEKLERKCSKCLMIGKSVKARRRFPTLSLRYVAPGHHEQLFTFTLMVQFLTMMILYNSYLRRRATKYCRRWYYHYKDELFDLHDSTMIYCKFISCGGGFF